jgi:2-polyprenyl-6-methoxyphenol hydroxylase-like FAD-dependent oxidoreductase
MPDHDVLIAGGGPVGLSLAVELGRRGVDAVVVDPIKPRSTQDLASMRDIPAPRAKLTNIRSMEHARRWGIAEQLRNTAPLPRDYPRNILFVTSLGGYELAKIESGFGYDGGDRDLFAEGPLQCPQFLVESVLRDHAKTLPSIALRYETRLESLIQDDDGVSVDITSAGGTQSTLRVRYVVGCDGARSTVREQIGVRMEGDSALSGSLNIIFRVRDLAARIDKVPAIHYWTINETAPGCCGPLDNHDVWWAVLGNVAQDLEGAQALDAAAILRAAIGFDIDVEVLDVSAWTPHKLLAPAFRVGRVFLAGDAAHLHSPFGGHGMNLGIGDAVDIGWKLAAVLAGWGGPRLLESYEIERRPLAARVIEEATRNYGAVSNAFVRPELSAATPQGDAARRAIEPEILRAKLPEFRSAGLVCGYSYDTSPVIVSDGTPPRAETVTEFVPSARPGSRAPHRWLADGSSLYDRFGSWFTLLTDSAHAKDGAMLVSAAEHRGVPVTLLMLDDARLPLLYAAAFTLIRPDQTVAWRADALPPDLNALLDTVRGVPIFTDPTEPAKP